MIRCYLIPALRAVRRTVAPRPRPLAAAVPGAVIRRAPRPLITVCRDAGLGGLLLATAAAAPLPEAAAPAEARPAGERLAVAPTGIAPLWSGAWGGFPPPADASGQTGLVPRPGSEPPVILVSGEPEPAGRAAVPEPSSLALFAAGVIAAPLLRRRYGR